MTKKALSLLLCACLLLVVAPVHAASLRLGDRGSQVTEIQRKLKQWGYYDGNVDGQFGEATQKAVMSFQRKNGLTPDGIVGTATAQAIGITLSGSTTTSRSSTSSRSDANLLARVVHGEARGESYTGKVAVAAVVLNRVRSSSFPNTISGVIYQKGAFSCVSNGSINNTPNNQSIRAALDALNGWDPTGGCLYYYNPRLTDDEWIRTRTVQTVIGNHYFAR